MASSNERIKQALEDKLTKYAKDGSKTVPDVKVEGSGDDLGPYIITVNGKSVKTVKTLDEIVAELK